MNNKNGKFWSQNIKHNDLGSNKTVFDILLGIFDIDSTISLPSFYDKLHLFFFFLIIPTKKKIIIIIIKKGTFQNKK